MDPFFKEPDANAQAPDNIRFENLIIEPFSDGRRVKLRVEITPFLENPNIEIEIFNIDGDLISNMSIVEIIEHKFDLTLHLQDNSIGKEFKLKALIFYTDLSHYEIKEDEEAPKKGKAENRIVSQIEKSFIAGKNNK